MFRNVGFMTMSCLVMDSALLHDVPHYNRVSVALIWWFVKLPHTV